MAELAQRFAEENAMPPPRFQEPKFSTAHVKSEVGVGYLILSLTSGRRFFCPENSPYVETQFSGSVSRCYEAWIDGGNWNDGGIRPDELEDEEPSFVDFGGQSYRFYLSRPLALKTCHIEELKLEAQWQQRELGELTGEDPVKEVAALQLLQSHPNVEELEEAMLDDTNIYKITTWYEGGELFDLAPMPEESAKAVFAELLDALDFVHSRGVCHRDVSLENVLMDTRVPERRGTCRSSSVSSIGSCISIASSTFSEATSLGSGYCCSSGEGNHDASVPGGRKEIRGDVQRDSPGWIGRPRLCDFGMSLRIPRSAKGRKASLTPQGRCGKNTCVAPEVFYDEVFDGEAVDAWSLGTTLFMALLGVQPWEEVGDYKFQAIAEGRNLEVVLQGWKLRHLLTQDAVDLLQAMLTADPTERLSDVKEILAHPWFHRTGK